MTQISLSLIGLGINSISPGFGVVIDLWGIVQALVQNIPEVFTGSFVARFDDLVTQVRERIPWRMVCQNGNHGVSE